MFTGANPFANTTPPVPDATEGIAARELAERLLATFASADGHAEARTWTGPTVARQNETGFNADDTRTQRPNPEANPTLAVPTPPQDPDRVWLMDRVPYD